eukprot:m51a1_g9924 hypothetical protein (189) ;mRNA; f:167072-167754
MVSANLCHSGAWAPLSKTGTKEFLELQYKTPVVPSRIEIFETYNPGFVVKISGRPSKEAGWTVLYQALTKGITSSRQWIPPLLPCATAVRHLRLDLDCTSAPSWTEIDCVKLVGRPGGQQEATATATASTSGPAGAGEEVSQWISRIIASSSTYGQGWEPETLIGPPKVFPQYGDIRCAQQLTWAYGV